MALCKIIEIIYNEVEDDNIHGIICTVLFL